MNKSKQLEFQYQTDLFTDICALETLKEAFKSVKRNKGAPGVDGITIEKYGDNLEENLVQLKTEVTSWTYKPTPVKRVEIPKPGGKGIRLLGSVQGSPLSPLLSNVVLDELDKELEKRNLEFCRFADDSNIFARTQRGAERIMESIKKFIEKKLKLKVNEEKSKTRKSNEVKFLGMTIVEGTIAIAKASYDKAMEKVKSLIPRGAHLSIENAMKEINTWYRGWASYFKMTQYPAQLKAIEAHIRRRLRARIVAQQKKKRNFLALLLKRGIKKKSAAKTVYSNRGIWNLSHTAAIDKAYTIEWFTKQAGQIIISNTQMGHWFGLEKWVKLV